MLFEKIHQKVAKAQESYKSLESAWEAFIKKSTYLIFDEKERFLKLAKVVRKFPRLYWFFFKSRRIIKNVKTNLARFEEKVNQYNENFIEKRLEKYASFFDGKDDNLAYGLDHDQRLAVIKDDKHNLVVAGAGSGKTSVLTTRIAYLIRREDKVDKDRILALAFTRNAAYQMEKRIKKNFNLEVSISTFHSLGWKIIKEETKKRPNLLFGGSEEDRNTLIADIFKTMLKEEKYRNILIDYMAYHIEPQVKEASFRDKEEYYRYMRNLRYKSLNGIEVKSVGERDITNFLFIHNIEFQYEPKVEWVDNDEEDKEYHPDFYLPKFDIYIEHWGLNENYEVAPWFTKSSAEYLEVRKWKLEQFEKYEKVLVETWDYERNRGTLISNLKKNLLVINEEIEFNPMSYEELVERVYDFKAKRNEITKLAISFVKIAKSNYLKPEKIRKRLKSGKYTQKQTTFGKLGLETYIRYQEYLKMDKKIDFDDMISIAAKLVKEHPEKYLDRYDHILIDEFQDISYQRYKLIKRFINEKSKTKLFCVGDDWQSIYQFAGSDVRFFVNFDEYFPHPEVSYLTQNYRSPEVIVNMSNNLIAQNKNKIEKETYSTKNHTLKPLIFTLGTGIKDLFRLQVIHAYNLIKNLIQNGVKPSEIMILSRFNRLNKELEIFCGSKEIRTEERAHGLRFHSAHGSKGLESKHVIVLGLTSGTYGFPCEILDASVLELVKRKVTENFFEEERRLFYVALTRSKKHLYLFTIENDNSMFLNEISAFLIHIRIDSAELWKNSLSEFIKGYIEGKRFEQPIICPVCGRALVEKEGRYGRFLGCSGFSTIGCKYTYNLEENYVRHDEILSDREKALIANERAEIMHDSRLSSLFIDNKKTNITHNNKTQRKSAKARAKRSKYKKLTIYNVIYDFETEKAVKFRREYDSKILWLPKSSLKNGIHRQRDKTQDVQLKFKPKNLQWREK